MIQFTASVARTVKIVPMIDLSIGPSIIQEATRTVNFELDTDAVFLAAAVVDHVADGCVEHIRFFLIGLDRRHRDIHLACWGLIHSAEEVEDGGGEDFELWSVKGRCHVVCVLLEAVVCDDNERAVSEHLFDFDLFKVFLSYV